MNMIDLLSSLPGAVAQGLIWGIMAVGVYITYKLLDIADLTVDGSICTGAAVCTMMLLSGRSLWLAVLCAVAAGLLAGVVTGLLHIWLGIPPILAGILTQMTLWSVNLKIMGKANQGLSVRDNHVLLSQMDVPGALVVLAIAAVLIIWVILNKTTFGYELKAVGFNRDASRYAGINEKRNIIMSMVIAGAIAGMAGGLLYLAGTGKHIEIKDVLASEGFTGISVALLGLSHPIGVLFSGLFIAYLTAGGFYLQLFEFSTEIIDIIVAVIIYFSAFALIVKTIPTRMNHKREKGGGRI